MAYIVAIDGPAGSGKGTVTELVAKKLGLVNIGSGSAYRCVALETINKGIDLKEKEKIINLLDEIEIEFKLVFGFIVSGVLNNICSLTQLKIKTKWSFNESLIRLE